MDIRGTLLLLLVIALSYSGAAQINCGSVDFTPNTPITVNFTYDSFSEYLGGITINNIGRLQIVVEDQAVPDPDCRWFLTMEVSNNPGAGTPATEWEELASYGTGTGSNPTIDIFEIRVRNACETSPINGVYQTFNSDGDITDIIANGLARNDAGNCNLNVNGPGSYLTNFNEYTFSIDVRVRPDFVFDPGVYELSVRFHIEEQP